MYIFSGFYTSTMLLELSLSLFLLALITTKGLDFYLIIHLLINILSSSTLNHAVKQFSVDSGLPNISRIRGFSLGEYVSENAHLYLNVIWFDRAQLDIRFIQFVPTVVNSFCSYCLPVMPNTVGHILEIHFFNFNLRLDIRVVGLSGR